MSLRLVEEVLAAPSGLVAPDSSRTKSAMRKEDWRNWSFAAGYRGPGDCCLAGVERFQSTSCAAACCFRSIPKLLKIPKSECPHIWIRLPRHKWPKSWSSMEDPVVPLERNLYGHPLAGVLWERQFEKVLLEHGWEKVSNWECLFVHRQKRIILICVCG